MHDSVDYRLQLVQYLLRSLENEHLFKNISNKNRTVSQKCTVIFFKSIFYHVGLVKSRQLVSFLKRIFDNETLLEIEINVI